LTRLPHTTSPVEMSDNEEENSHDGFDALDHQVSSINRIQNHRLKSCAASLCLRSGRFP
jgi:hypothetical protein